MIMLRIAVVIVAAAALWGVAGVPALAQGMPWPSPVAGGAGFPPYPGK